MKLEFLDTLDAILRRGSFAGAADEMGLTPAAVSLQVKRLEEHFGQPLFVRSARVAQPTDIARELARTMRDALTAMEALRVRSTPVVEGRIVVGTIRTVQTSILPRALLEVYRRYPKLFVRAIQGDSGILMQHLKTGLLDAAVLIRPTSGGPSRFHWASLTKESFVLIAPPNSRGDSLEELLPTYEWIQFDTALVSGRMAARYLHRLAPRARGSVEVDSIDTVHALVSAGRGISVVPKRTHLISKVLPVREIPLDDADEREISFVCRAMDKDNRRVQALREAFDFAYQEVES